MIGVTILLCGVFQAGDYLRYNKKVTSQIFRKTKPVVVWNSTRSCNLKGIHCFPDTTAQVDWNKLTADAACVFNSDLIDPERTMQVEGLLTRNEEIYSQRKHLEVELGGIP